jgi:hypothetical protein
MRVLTERSKHAHNFLDYAAQKNMPTLIHCDQGVSRSPTILISYIMAKRKISFRDAFMLVAERRRCVAPNISFVSQLLEYEQSLLGICDRAFAVTFLRHRLHNMVDSIEIETAIRECNGDLVAAVGVLLEELKRRHADEYKGPKLPVECCTIL